MGQKSSIRRGVTLVAVSLTLASAAELSAQRGESQLRTAATDCSRCHELDASHAGARGSWHGDLECSQCHRAVEVVDDSTCPFLASGATPSSGCALSECHGDELSASSWHAGLPKGVAMACLRCHDTASWKLPGGGDACDACHVIPAKTGVFDHLAHRSVECSSCHDTQTSHASLKILSGSQCMECHHGASSDFVDECGRCHGDGPGGSKARARLNMTISVWDEPGDREVEFPHDVHTFLDCSDCHDSPASAVSTGICADCHDSHHEASSDCSVCHYSFDADMHDVDVHGACADCHDFSFELSFAGSRTACLLCHGDRVDHEVGEACLECHEP